MTDWLRIFEDAVNPPEDRSAKDVLLQGLDLQPTREQSEANRQAYFERYGNQWNSSARSTVVYARGQTLTGLDARRFLLDQLDNPSQALASAKAGWQQWNRSFLNRLGARGLGR